MLGYNCCLFLVEPPKRFEFKFESLTLLDHYEHDPWCGGMDRIDRLFGSAGVLAFFVLGCSLRMVELKLEALDGLGLSFA